MGFLTDDTFRAANWTLDPVIQLAYGFRLGDRGMVSGEPAWLSSEKYDILAKMDSSTADRLKKLTPDERELAQRQMLQSLLADRLKLVVHRESREFPVYALIIAKGGAKLKEAKPGDTYKDGFPYAKYYVGGDALAGKIFDQPVVAHDGRIFTKTMYGFGVSTAALARQLTISAGQTVKDRTALKASYDFTLTYSPALGPMAPGAGPQPDPIASDPSDAPDLFVAIQKQLGLKLEPGKGPIEIIVIDHVERSSAN
jgi:uncharacterized protein (TIGR03435 family)